MQWIPPPPRNKSRSPSDTTWPVRIGAAQRIGDRGVLGDAVGRRNDGAVRQVKVDIRAAVDVLPVGNRGTRRFGNRQQLEMASARVGFGLENSAVLRHERKSWIEGIDHGFKENRSRPDEGHVAVDVAVGRIVAEVARQPDDFAHPEHGTQLGIGLGLAPSGIAIGIEHARFGGNQGSLAVRQKSAALDDEIRPKHGRRGARRDARPELRVLVEGQAFAAPGVEGENGGRTRARCVENEGRSGVAQPRIVHGNGNHPH